MANKDAAFGMNPVEKIGSGPSGKLGDYKIAASEGTAIFQGSVVMPDAGHIQLGIAANAPFTGVFWGCKYDDPTTNKPTFKNQYATTTAVADAFVYDDPYQVFEIQADGAYAQTAIQQAADITAESGSTTTGVSTQELDSSDIGTGANLLIIGFSGSPDRGQVGNANGVFKVLIQEHTYANL